MDWINKNSSAQRSENLMKKMEISNSTNLTEDYSNSSDDSSSSDDASSNKDYANDLLLKKQFLMSRYLTVREQFFDIFSHNKTTNKNNSKKKSRRNVALERTVKETFERIKRLVDSYVEETDLPIEENKPIQDLNSNQ